MVYMMKWDLPQIFQNGSKLRCLLTQTISRVGQMRETMIMQTDTKQTFVEEKNKQYSL